MEDSSTKEPDQINSKPSFSSSHEASSPLGVSRSERDVANGRPSSINRVASPQTNPRPQVDAALVSLRSVIEQHESLQSALDQSEQEIERFKQLYAATKNELDRCHTSYSGLHETYQARLKVMKESYKKEQTERIECDARAKIQDKVKHEAEARILQASMKAVDEYRKECEKLRVEKRAFETERSEWAIERERLISDHHIEVARLQSNARLLSQVSGGNGRSNAPLDHESEMQESSLRDKDMLSPITTASGRTSLETSKQAQVQNPQCRDPILTSITNTVNNKLRGPDDEKTPFGEHDEASKSRVSTVHTNCTSDPEGLRPTEFSLSSRKVLAPDSKLNLNHLRPISRAHTSSHAHDALEEAASLPYKSAGAEYSQKRKHEYLDLSINNEGDLPDVADKKARYTLSATKRGQDNLYHPPRARLTGDRSSTARGRYTLSSSRRSPASASRLSIAPPTYASSMRLTPEIVLNWRTVQAFVDHCGYDQPRHDCNIVFQAEGFGSPLQAIQTGDTSRFIGLNIPIELQESVRRLLSRLLSYEDVDYRKDTELGMPLQCLGARAARPPVKSVWEDGEGHACEYCLSRKSYCIVPVSTRGVGAFLVVLPIEKSKRKAGNELSAFDKYRIFDRDLASSGYRSYRGGR